MCLCSTGWWSRLYNYAYPYKATCQNVNVLAYSAFTDSLYSALLCTPGPAHCACYLGRPDHHRGQVPVAGAPLWQAGGGRRDRPGQLSDCGECSQWWVRPSEGPRTGWKLGWGVENTVSKCAVRVEISEKNGIKCRKVGHKVIFLGQTLLMKESDSIHCWSDSINSDSIHPYSLLNEKYNFQCVRVEKW